MKTDPTIWDDPARLEEWTVFHLLQLRRFFISFLDLVIGIFAV